MFENINSKIKNLAAIIFVVSVIGGIIWFIASFSLYNDNKTFINSDYSEYYLKAIRGKSGMIYSVILLVSGIISSFLIYGFGELIERVRNIDYKLNGKPKENIEEKVSDEEIIAELEKENKNEMARSELLDKYKID